MILTLLSEQKYTNQWETSIDVSLGITVNISALQANNIYNANCCSSTLIHTTHGVLPWQLGMSSCSSHWRPQGDLHEMDPHSRTWTWNLAGRETGTWSHEHIFIMSNQSAEYWLLQSVSIFEARRWQILLMQYHVSSSADDEEIRAVIFIPWEWIICLSLSHFRWCITIYRLILLSHVSDTVQMWSFLFYDWWMEEDRWVLPV